MADKEQIVQETLQRIEDATIQLIRPVLEDFFDKAQGAQPAVVPQDSTKPDAPKDPGLTQADVDLAVHQALAAAQAEYEKQLETLELDEEADLKAQFEKAIKKAKAAQGASDGQPKSGSEDGQEAGGDQDGSKEGSGASGSGADKGQPEEGSEVGASAASGNSGASDDAAPSNAQRASADPLKA